MSENILKLQRPYTDEEARANLRDFVDTEDRDPPPIFVGRDEIMDRVGREVTRCRSNVKPDACFTIVIQGAPGCGKTSLLAEIKNRLGSQENNSRVGNPVIAEKIPGDFLSSPETVANHLIEACKGKYLEVQKEKQTSVSGRVGPKWLSIGGKKTTKVKRLQDQIDDAGSLWHSVKVNTNIDLKNTVLLLLIDESQNIGISDPSDPSGRNSIATALHNGFGATQGLKIVPVFAGLSNTEQVLGKRGISRIRGSPIQLGGLSDDETRELVTAWLQHSDYGFSNLFSSEDISRVSKIITVASEGWPRHVNTYLLELGRSLLEHGALEDGKVDLTEALERGHNRRREYYYARLTDADLDKYEDVIRMVAGESKDGILRVKDLHAIADSEFGITQEESNLLRKEAIKAGILETSAAIGQNNVRFPIPSFQTYMLCEGDIAMFQTKMREQIQAQSYQWAESKGLTR